LHALELGTVDALTIFVRLILISIGTVRDFRLATQSR
jgi:hypothetical protein